MTLNTKEMTLKTTFFTGLVFLISWTMKAQTPSDDYMKSYNESMERTAWMEETRFGMFIHFGAYAVPARGEWVRNGERISNEDYQVYVDQFNPVDCDMTEWAKLAKQAGMKYAVMTSKHHDGFCLFESEYTDYSTAETINRDLVKEFVEAFRAEGLKVGLYYSLIDWHHDDYPKYNDAHHPMRGNEAYKNEEIDWENYLEYMHGQVNEITSNYGKIDVLWMDFSYDEMMGEKWKAKELVDMVRSNQPGIILNNRLSASGEGHFGKRDFYLGDFDTPEQGVPEKELVDEYGNPLRWETCLTLNNNWGYSRNDNNWKSPELVVHTLIDIVSKNGNLLLNVGPDARGNIPEPSKKILKEVGKWMDKNHESIYGCGKSDLPVPEWGRITQKDNVLYLHWMYPKVGYLNMKGFSEKTEEVLLLHDGSEASTAKGWWGSKDEDNFLINFNTPIYHTFPHPVKYSTVFKMILKE